MQQDPQPNHTISSLSPYQPGTPIATIARTYGIDEANIIKLASNENPRAPSKHAMNAATQAMQGLRFYPDAYDFIQTVAKHHSVDESNVIIGNGSNDILDLIARTYLDSESESLIYEHSFLVYKLASSAVGATIIETKAKDFGYDLAAILTAISPKTRVIWIDNPNNPTGTFIESATLKQFIAKVPPHILIVIDEAYWDYLPDGLRHDTVRWTEEFRNVIVVRTFSKIHALAALRVGYAIGHRDLIEPLNRLRQPFNVNAIGLAAASASLIDAHHITHERDENLRIMKLFTEGLANLELSFIPSHANFVTVQLPNCKAVHENLMKAGIITRPIANYGLADHLRITVGVESDIERILSTLAAIITK